MIRPKTLLALAALGLSGALAACGHTTPAGSRLAECQAQADADPDVQAAILRANSPLQEVRVAGVRDQKIALDRAVRRCLGGNRYGVEPVTPTY